MIRTGAAHCVNHDVTGGGAVGDTGTVGSEEDEALLAGVTLRSGGAVEAVKRTGQALSFVGGQAAGGTLRHTLKVVEVGAAGRTGETVVVIGTSARRTRLVAVDTRGLVEEGVVWTGL